MTIEAVRDAGPPRKKLRRASLKKAQASSSGSASTSAGGLYAPFRALGLITNHVPFAVQTRAVKGSSTAPKLHILTCLGRSWAMWDGEHMTLLFVGTDLEAPITSLIMVGDAIWAASGPYAVKFWRGKIAFRLQNPLETVVAKISVFGQLMLGLTEDGRHLLVWDMHSKEIVNTISFDLDFTASHVLHPATYLNKVVVASREGTMQLWNISTGMRIHQFEAASLRSSPAALNGTQQLPGNVPITALVQGPAVDVIGIGFASGDVSIYDIRADELMMSVNMGAGLGLSGDTGEITGLGFRSDGEPILATASSTGNVAFWDLGHNGRLLNVLRGAHDGSVTALEWIAGQPLLLTSGDDNTVKQWLFDSATEPPRLLKFRGGHQSPPHLIRFYGQDGKQLLSASRDRSLRYTSVVRDSRSFELSQGSLLKKSVSLSVPAAHLKHPPVTALAFSSTRSKDWEDVVTAHTASAGHTSTSSSFARTWSVQNKRIGRWVFGLSEDRPGVDKKGPKERPKITPLDTGREGDGTVRSVFVTACGNFGVIGDDRGQITLWNLESGIKRRTYELGRVIRSDETGELTPSLPVEKIANKKSKRPAARKSKRVVSGVAVDSLNRILVAITLNDTVEIFDFHSSKHIRAVSLPSTPVSLSLHPDNGLAAITCDDMVVRIFDIETQKVVRECKGAKSKILDVSFSPDCRWLVVSALDSIIRTYDIPTGKLIDAFKVPSVATSISFSPTGEFLATAHVDSVGVFLWANRAQYSNVALTGVSEESALARRVSLPGVDGFAEEEALEGLSALTLNGPSTDSADIYSTPEQLGEELVTLTFLPRSRWQTLLNLETIIQRNKPKEPPKAPEQAPFFLPSLRNNKESGLEQFVPPDDSTLDADRAQESFESSRQRVEKARAYGSEFQRRLLESDETEDYESFFRFAKMLTPSALDLELRALAPMSDFMMPGSTPTDEDTHLLRFFMKALVARLRSHKDFEAVQAFISVILRVHGPLMISRNEGEDDSMREGDERSGSGLELSDALEELLEVQIKESERVLDLVASTLGTLSFVRDTM